MRALILALLLTALPAQAFEYILPCTGTQGPLPTPVPTRVSVMPAQVKGGTCGSYILGYAPTGVVGGYWCQAAPDRQPYPVMGAARWSVFTPQMLAELAAIPLASDPGEAARLFQVAYATTNFYNLCDVWGHPDTDWRVRFNAAMPTVVQPPPITSLYVVTKRTGSTTQNTYNYVNGKRIPGAVGTIDILTGGLPTPCLDTPVILEWPLTYVGVTPTTVALCSRR
jgi:hypothetical protein